MRRTQRAILDYLRAYPGARPCQVWRALGRERACQDRNVHRHLACLLALGLVVRRGTYPRRRYYVAGAPEGTADGT